MVLPHDEIGSGPAVVLIHAGIADRGMWEEHLRPLAAAGYRVVPVDLPGFGEAPAAPGGAAPWADVIETMDALGIERATLVGNSFGGAVALRVALTAPGRVAALALISAPSPAFEPSPELEAVWEAEEAALARGDFDGAVEVVIEAWTQPDAPPKLRDRVASMQRQAYAAQAGVATDPESSDPFDDDLDALSRVDRPALVAAGERDYREFVSGAEAMARVLPRAQHVVLEGAGHLAPLETPDAFRELLLGFLANAAR